MNINFQSSFPAIQNFLRYLCQQCFHSERYLSLKVLSIFFQKDQSNNNQELEDDDEQIQKIKKELTDIDFSAITPFMSFIDEHSVVDSCTFLRLLKLQETDEYILSELLNLLEVKPLQSSSR